MYRKYVEAVIVEAIRVRPGIYFTSPELKEEASKLLGRTVCASNIGFYLKVLERHGYLETVSESKESGGKYNGVVYMKKHLLDYYEPRFVGKGFEGPEARVNDINLPSQKEAL